MCGNPISDDETSDLVYTTPCGDKFQEATLENKFDNIIYGYEQEVNAHYRNRCTDVPYTMIIYFAHICTIYVGLAQARPNYVIGQHFYTCIFTTETILEMVVLCVY